MDATSAYSDYNINNFSGTRNSLMIKVNPIETIVVPAYSSVAIGFAGGTTMEHIKLPTSTPVGNPPT